MPMTDRIRSEVIAIVAEVAELPPEEVTADKTLRELGVDSLGGLRIVAEVEKRYGIVIAESEIGKIRSMADVLALVDTNMLPE
jgi:acyl carrier protein